MSEAMKRLFEKTFLPATLQAQDAKQAHVEYHHGQGCQMLTPEQLSLAEDVQELHVDDTNLRQWEEVSRGCVIDGKVSLPMWRMFQTITESLFLTFTVEHVHLQVLVPDAVGRWDVTRSHCHHAQRLRGYVSYLINFFEECK
jgi:hypothetical protein